MRRNMIKSNRRPIVTGVLLGFALAPLALPARAQDNKDNNRDNKDGKAERSEPATAGPPTRAEFAKLQGEVREQRQLIIEMLQTEQQRYDMLLRLLRQGGAPPAADAAPAPALGEAPAADAAHKALKKTAAAPPEHRLVAVDGRVAVTGGSAADIYVYVDGRGPSAGHRAIEIKQEGRQFNPRVAVVQSGTNVTFPNMDSVYHNVFSNSPRNAFDLGTYQAGDKARSVTVTGPGVVEVYCNLHQKMSAKILVVPNGLYTKVRADGTFHLDNVPAGTRRLVAWSPETKPAAQRVEVAGATTQVSFSLEHQDAAAHPNKFGQAYGSYKD
jgi:plastocyanin